MRIPQLFIRVGPNRFSPVTSPVYSKPLYFWDERSQRIIPAEGQLKISVLEGVAYFVEDGVVDSGV